MNVDKNYCMSSYLMFRTIADSNKCFKKGMIPNYYHPPAELQPIHDSNALNNYLQMRTEQICNESKAALALSGGIDSAILARFMPKGSVAYTFKCIVPGVQVIDETPIAAKYAKECGLEHRIVEVYWEDFEKYSPLLMKYKGAPIHSIEVQIYKAALQAKSDGIDTLIFGETADANYGGFSGLHSKDWTIGEYVDRYSYVKPYHALKEFNLIMEPYKRFEDNGMMDVHRFFTEFYLYESMGSYTNACQCADITIEAPYAETTLAEPLDLVRIRNGENKYIVREVFQSLYPNYATPPKIPMPRPMNEWLKDWSGPKRSEFWPNCIENMTGDQKWLVWALEQFLNIIDEEDI